MKRLIALTMCAVSLGALPYLLKAQDLSPCLGTGLIQTDLVLTCENEVWLQSLAGPLLWNQELFADSILILTNGLVEVQEARLDLSIVDLGEEFGYLNLGNGFNNLTFPITIASRFSIPIGYDNGQLFASDEGLGYSGISLSLNQNAGWFETFIGDGTGAGPAQRRSKKSYCSLLTDTWYTVVAVIRGATDHSIYLNGVELNGDYSGSGNGQIVDLGRPATMGYHIPDSGPLVGQELSSAIKFDFLGVYDFELQASDIQYAEFCHSEESDAPVRPLGAVGWYDFDEAEPLADSEGNQPSIQVVGGVDPEVVYCLCPGIQQVDVQFLDCEFADFFCGEGTSWDADSQTCIVTNPSDSNLDGCVQLNDLLDLLSVYGDCGAEESAWQCGDALEYQGYDYETVQIGEQCWFAENLRSENYANGDVISAQPDGNGWVLSGAAAEEYNQATSVAAIYGLLYNAYAVQDERNICPNGWSVPTDGHWQGLEVTVGMDPWEADDMGWRGEPVGHALKAVDGWQINNGTDDYGFRGLGGGVKYPGGAFSSVGGIGAYWTSTPAGEATMLVRETIYNVDGVARHTQNKAFGFSVRCIQDSE
tara:strand:- start:157 stop:1929 length:1773 start_codon:yes stop_codon:yes gene_type:complete